MNPKHPLQERTCFGSSGSFSSSSWQEQLMERSFANERRLKQQAQEIAELKAQVKELLAEKAERDSTCC
tara:strand:+ start:460 stop:666 length:207 start_codon:yes stop_codon:yes gene_type:complete